MADLRTHPVIALLLERIAAGSRPGARSDPHTLALAIEGGGMRGVVSAGMATALGDLGARLAFDIVIGVSAGASNGYGLVGDVGADTALTYVNGCTDGVFIDPRRAMRRRGPIMDLDHLVDDLVLGAHPEAVGLALGSGVRLGFVATDVASAEPVTLTGVTTRRQLRAALIASSLIPGIAGEPVPYDGRRFVDGTVSESIPYQAALRAGATHVFVLQTRPYGVPLRPPSMPERLIVGRTLLRINTALEERYRTRPIRYAHAVDTLAAGTESGDGPPYLASIRPARGTPPVGHLEQDRPTLLTGAISGVKAVHTALTGSEPWVDGRLRVRR